MDPRTRPYVLLLIEEYDELVLVNIGAVIIGVVIVVFDIVPPFISILPEFCIVIPDASILTFAFPLLVR